MPEAERALLEQLLSRVRSPALRWEHEDGRSLVFGRGEPVAHVRWTDRATRRTLRAGTLGFCDAYVNGDWRVRSGRLVDVMTALVAARLNQPINAEMPLGLRARLAAAHLAAHAGRGRAHAAVRSHYDLDEAFYALWLDASMTYTCGYARAEGASLEEMQRDKLDLVCEKLRLREGQRLLDLGCGWGSLALHAARSRGAFVTAVNVSRPQLERLRRCAAGEGLSARIDVVEGDFREARGAFDRVTAIGLAEHVGKGRLGDLFRVIAARLREGGAALVHTIGSSTTGGTDPWLERRVFPGSYVPTLAELVAHAERSGLRVAHVENIGAHYAPTLRHWLARFETARDEVRARYGERFYRTGEMYLAMLVPTFEHLSTGVYQVLMTKGEAAVPEIERAGACS